MSEAYRKRKNPEQLKRCIEYTNARWLLENEAQGKLSYFADVIGRYPQQVGAMIGPNPSRVIGESIARHIEKSFDKPDGWLSTSHDLEKEKVSAKDRTHPREDEPVDHGQFFSPLIGSLSRKPVYDPLWVELDLRELHQRLRVSDAPDELKQARISLAVPVDPFGHEPVAVEIFELMQKVAVLLTLRTKQETRLITYERCIYELREGQGGSRYVLTQNTAKHSIAPHLLQLNGQGIKTATLYEVIYNSGNKQESKFILSEDPYQRFPSEIKV